MPEMWGVWPLETDGVTNSACCLQMHAKQGLPAPSPCRQQKQFKASDPQACDGFKGSWDQARVESPQAGSMCVSQSRSQASLAG